MPSSAHSRAASKCYFTNRIAWSIGASSLGALGCTDAAASASSMAGPANSSFGGVPGTLGSVAGGGTGSSPVGSGMMAGAAGAAPGGSSPGGAGGAEGGGGLSGGGAGGSGGSAGAAGHSGNGDFSDGLFAHADLKGHCLNHGLPDKDGKSVVLSVGEAYDVTAVGAEIGHHCGSDQGRFLYVEIEGDFDVSVQLAHMDNGGAVTDGRGRPTPTKAGLMARVGLDPSDLFIAMHASEPIEEFPDAWSFDRRAQHNGNLATGGFDYGFINNGSPLFERELPNIFVRLKRTGNTFYGYASTDGSNWVASSKPTYVVEYPPKLYVGLSQMSAPENERDSVESLTHFRMLRGFPTLAALAD